MKKIFSLLAAVLFAGSMMAADVVKATLDFTDNTAWKLPVGSAAGITTDSAYSDGTYTIRLAAATKYYFHTDGYLLFGKSGSTLTLPAFDFDVTKIVVTGRAGASGSTKQNIFVGENAVSTETTGAQVANEYAIASNYQAAGNIYVLKVTSAHNTQVTKIEIYGEGETPKVEPVLFKAENVEADAETSVVAASAVLVDDAVLKVENVYESFVSGTSHPYAIAPGDTIKFLKALQVRASTYPAGEDLIGENNNNASTADNKKASPLVLTAKEDVEVIFYYRRQSSNTVYEVEGDKNSPIVSVEHNQNDGKDLIVYDQADIATKMVTEYYALADAANEEYAFAVKGFKFEKGHVYTLTAKGTTLPLFGFEYVASGTVEPQPEEPVVADTLTVAEAIDLGMALDSMATSEAVYAVEGYVINAGAFSQLYRNQTWEMADAADATASGFKAYNCFPIEGTDTLKVLNGDKVLLIGHLKKYKGKNDTVYTIEIEKGNAEFISKVEGDHSIAVETEAITVAQALEIGAALANNGVTEKMYKITGYVSAEDPKGAYSDQYGNQSFWVADEAGSTAATNAEGAFYVYRGKPDTKAAITVGSKVEFTCTIKKFVKDATTGPVIENADQNIVIKVLEAGVVELDTLNVTQAVAAALALEDNAESAKPVAVLGYVAKIETAYSAQYGNISFFMTDDAVSAEAYGDLKVFRGNIDEAAGKALVPGDRVMVVGKLKNNFYNEANSAQIATGSEVTVLWKQAIEQIVLTEKVNKVIMDGVIYIVRDGKLYNLQGAQVR